MSSLNIIAASNWRCLGCGASYRVANANGVCHRCGGPLLRICLIGKDGEEPLELDTRDSVTPPSVTPQAVPMLPARAAIEPSVIEGEHRFCGCGHPLLDHFGDGPCMASHSVGSVCPCSTFVEQDPAAVA